VLRNGKIITVDEKFTIAQAVAVKGDRIIAEGTTQQIDALAGSNTRRIDLKGKTVLPGLIDNHAHLWRAAATGEEELRLDGVDARKEALAMIAARAKSLRPGEWVTIAKAWSPVSLVDFVVGGTTIGTPTFFSMLCRTRGFSRHAVVQTVPGGTRPQNGDAGSPNIQICNLISEWRGGPLRAPTGASPP
jgi:hypothetical protein